MVLGCVQALKNNPEGAPRELKVSSNRLTRFGQVALQEALDMVIVHSSHPSTVCKWSNHARYCCNRFGLNVIAETDKPPYKGTGRYHISTFRMLCRSMRWLGAKRCRYRSRSHCMTAIIHPSRICQTANCYFLSDEFSFVHLHYFDELMR
jgi:hypothetical protein